MTRLPLLGMAFVYQLGFATEAYSQIVVPSQVAPQSLRPPVDDFPPPAVTDAPSPPATPTDAGTLRTTVGAITIDGGFVELASANALTAARLAHRSVSVAEIYSAARELESAYARAGFLLARVTVPPQRLVPGGGVRILVTDGRIEDINTDALPARVKSPVRSRLLALIGKRHLQAVEIERALMIATDVPGLALKSALARGSTDGGVVLIVEGKHAPVSLAASVDNRLPSSLGRWQWNTSIALNGLLGRGEQLYASLASVFDWDGGGIGHPPLLVSGTGLVVPVGRDGWSINPEYLSARTTGRQRPGVPATRGRFDKLSVRSLYPVVRDRSHSLTLAGSIDLIAQRLRATTFSVDLSRDRYVAARAGVTGQRRIASGGDAELGMQLSQGLLGRNVSRAIAPDVPLTRSGASPEFSKAVIHGRLATAIHDRLRLDVTARAQSSFGKPIFSSEQFALDGADAVSAFATGTFPVDSGVTLRSELSRPLTLGKGPASLRVHPYVFGAVGVGTRVQPTAAEPRDVSLGAAGIGFRSLADAGLLKGTGLSAELSRQFSDVPKQRESFQAWIGASFRY